MFVVVKMGRFLFALLFFQMMNLWMVFHGDFCEGDGFD